MSLFCVLRRHLAVMAATGSSRGGRGHCGLAGLGAVLAVISLMAAVPVMWHRHSDPLPPDRYVNLNDPGAGRFLTAGLMLVQRLRRWTSIQQAVGQRLAFPGKSVDRDCKFPCHNVTEC